MTAHRPEQSPAAQVPVQSVAELLEAITDLIEAPSAGDRAQAVDRRAFQLLDVLDHVRTAGVTAERLRLATETIRNRIERPDVPWRPVEPGQEGDPQS